MTLENNNKPFYQTTTDSNGHLSIPSNNLPNFSYSLIAKFIGINITNRLSPDVFAQENKIYLAKNNINLMLSDSANNNATQQGKINSNQQTNPSLINQTNSAVQTQSAINNQKKNNFIMILLFFAFIFIALTVCIVLYVKKQKNMNKLDESTKTNH